MRLWGSGNKTSFLGFTLLIVVVVMFFYLREAQTRRREPDVQSRWPEIAGIDLDREYPETPQDVVELYERIKLALYDGGIEDAEIALAFAKQQRLYGKELLELNPFDKRIQSVTDEVLAKRGAKDCAVSYVILEKTEPEDGKCSVTAEETSTAGTVNMKYNLIREDGKWKIYSWKKL
ncbi:MAG: hypothetical protein LBU36_03915 [Clostridiales bacterium]|jgi:hypothetical protein|nr:hypothetical protein [Clostridiales bacterium]